MFVLVLALIGCVTTHHGPEGTTYEAHVDAIDARILRDGDLVEAAIAKGSHSVPVAVHATTNDGRRSTTFDVNVGGPVVPAYVSGLDPRLAQLVQYSAAYRPAWNAVNVGVPGRPVSYGSAPTSSVLELGSSCPTDRDPATQAERDACQESDISHILDVVGTVEVK